MFHAGAVTIVVMFIFESLKVSQYYTELKRRYILIPGAKLSIAKCLQMMKNENHNEQVSLIPLQGFTTGFKDAFALSR